MGRTYHYGERWHRALKGLHSTELEAHAVANAIEHWAPLLRNTNLTVRSDCSSVVADITRARVGSAKLLPSIQRVFACMEELNISIAATHLAGVLNIASDRLSRCERHSGLVLQAEEFAKIQRELGPCTVDTFATEKNAKLPRFWSLLPSTKAEAIDFFAQPLSRKERY